MSLGRVNASARKRISGCLAWISRIAHSQNGNGFVWGLSTRKMRTPWPIQNSRISLQASHRACRSAGSAGHMLIG